MPFLSAQETVKTYKSLSQVEQSFRSLKTVDLKIRPIYHFDKITEPTPLQQKTLD